MKNLWLTIVCLFLTFPALLAQKLSGTKSFTGEDGAKYIQVQKKNPTSTQKKTIEPTKKQQLNPLKQK